MSDCEKVKWHTKHKFGGKSRKKNERRGRKRKLTNDENDSSALNVQDAHTHDTAEASRQQNRRAAGDKRSGDGPQTTNDQAEHGPTPKKVKHNRAKNVIGMYRDLDNTRSASRDTPYTAATENPHSGFDNFIMNFGSFNSMLSILKCPKCRSVDVLSAHSGRLMGFATQVKIFCSRCNSDIHSCYSTPQNFSSEKNPSRAPFEINQRAVLAARNAGLGHVALNKVFGVMNINGGLHHKTYARITDELHPTLVHGTLFETLQDAHELIRTAYLDLDKGIADQDIIDVCVSFDGSWQRRRYGSLYGVGFSIDTLTGLVTDYDLRSKYCHECSLVGAVLNGEEKVKWKQLHAPQCDINFDGPSGNMESDIAKSLWARSEDFAQMRYTGFVGDGDSATYKQLCDLNPYGNAHPIVKEECINHIQKRMYTGLKKEIDESKTAADGVKLGGRGKLTNDRILRWQSYYRNAITNNSGNLRGMQNAIWAILFHSTANPEDTDVDQDRAHQWCGEWCYWRKAKASGDDPVKVMKKTEIDRPLSREIGKKLTPLFKRLSNEELLNRCMRSATQNTNECLHSVLWRKIPKTTFITRKTLECGIALAVSEYNKGCKGLKDTLEAIGLEAGKRTEKLIEKTDQRRISSTGRRVGEAAEDSRKAKKQAKARKSQEEKEENDILYGSGMF